MRTKDQIIHIIEQIDDKKVLKDILNLITAIYKHYKSGKWER